MCLRKGHRNDQCQQNKSCRRCQGNHHQSICEKPFQPAGSDLLLQFTLTRTSRETHEAQTKEVSASNEILNATSVSHATTTSARNSYKVLLQTAASYAQGSNSSSQVSVRILLDSGCQRSYVTNALKDKLKLVPT